MPFDRKFAEAFVQAMANSGWRTILPAGEMANPLALTFSGPQKQLRLIIHARRLTPQSSPTSTHNRPEGEMHTQMLFDGDQKGKGARNYLRLVDGAQTLLLGFYPIQGSYVVAAYDPQKHREYSYSASLQIKEETILKALETGFALSVRKNAETVAAFHIDEITTYLDHAHEFHDLLLDLNLEAADDAPSAVREVFSRSLHIGDAPHLEAKQRRQVMVETARYIREKNFEQGIKRVYDRCAICGFQYDYILDAAHIIPVSEGGTDTYDNGLGLCPTCHRMYDKGFILVDGEGTIYINPYYAKMFEELERAGSVATLRKTLRKTLWLPSDEQYHPSPHYLQRVFEMRRKKPR